MWCSYHFSLFIFYFPEIPTPPFEKYLGTLRKYVCGWRGVSYQYAPLFFLWKLCENFFIKISHSTHISHIPQFATTTAVIWLLWKLCENLIKFLWNFFHQNNTKVPNYFKSFSPKIFDNSIKKCYNINVKGWR